RSQDLLPRPSRRSTRGPAEYSHVTTAVVESAALAVALGPARRGGPALLEDDLVARQAALARRVLRCQGRLRRVADDDDRPDEAVLGQAQQLADERPDAAGDPGDAGPQADELGGDEHPLGGSTVVVGARDGVVVLGQDDG